MSFKDFLGMWQSGTLDTDATWRGYGAKIKDVHSDKHVCAALKDMSLSYAGELAVGQFMSLYGLEDPAEARRLLGCWWLWQQLSTGKRKRLRRLLTSGLPQI